MMNREQLLEEMRSVISNDLNVVGEIMGVLSEFWLEYLTSLKNYTESKHVRALDDLVWVASCSKNLSRGQTMAIARAYAQLPSASRKINEHEVRELCDVYEFDLDKIVYENNSEGE